MEDEQKPEKVSTTGPPLDLEIQLEIRKKKATLCSYTICKSISSL